ncbi:MAG: hypothetical protein P8J20_02705 [Novosphingobium sp.]|nr:hypothetical protein [Novosphingobium sp.]
MKLRTETVLEGIAEALRDRIAPNLDDGFAANDARIAQTLLAITRLARDDEVANKVEENRRLREIFLDAAPAIDDPTFAERLEAASRTRDPGLRIAELDAETGRLRNLLVELHAHVEQQEGEEARRIDQSIWRALRDIEAPRAPRA